MDMENPSSIQTTGEYMSVQHQPEPSMNLTDSAELFAGFLDYYRSVILSKLDGLSEDELRSARLPSGWTPLGLLKHLTYVERRWFRWGFLGEAVEDPWGKGGPGSDWIVEPYESREMLIASYHQECDRSRAILASAGLEDRSQSGGRFNLPGEHPALIWILFHMLQEYARHAGQLDVVRELADGAVGE
jgi:uncharacterized damage-inducible protein DinB